MPSIYSQSGIAFLAALRLGETKESRYEGLQSASIDWKTNRSPSRNDAKKTSEPAGFGVLSV